MDISTPSLFPAISLFFLSFTNKFMNIAKLIRDLKVRYEDEKTKEVYQQILNLRRRIKLIRNMQALAVLSFFFCIVSIIMIMFNALLWGEVSFGLSLIMILLSLSLSIYEINISIDALNIELEEF